MSHADETLADIERALLALVLDRPEYLPAVAAQIKPEHLATTARTHILRAAQSLAAAGQPFDRTFVLRHLAEHDLAAICQEELAACESAIRPESVAAYAAAVRAAWKTREADKTAARLQLGDISAETAI